MRLPSTPLEIPAEFAQDPEDFLRRGAVQLFLARARTTKPRFAADAKSIETIGAICRRLDGIPLAIELAAARAATLGVEEIATHLDNCFMLLKGGQRTASQHHQTLRATLDWSYELLPAVERMIVRHLRMTYLLSKMTYMGNCISEASALLLLKRSMPRGCDALLIFLEMLSARLPYRVGCPRQIYSRGREIEADNDTFRVSPRGGGTGVLLDQGRV